MLDGSLELERLDALPDDEVIAELTAVKGIGEWSSHMFLMFHLGRPDVLAVGDLGIRKAMMAAYGLDAVPYRRRWRRSPNPGAVPDAGLPIPVALAQRRPRLAPATGPQRS